MPTIRLANGGGAHCQSPLQILSLWHLLCAIKIESPAASKVAYQIIMNNILRTLVAGAAAAAAIVVAEPFVVERYG